MDHLQLQSEPAIYLFHHSTFSASLTGNVGEKDSFGVERIGDSEANVKSQVTFKHNKFER